MSAVQNETAGPFKRKALSVFLHASLCSTHYALCACLVYVSWPKKSEIPTQDPTLRLSELSIKNGDLILVEQAAAQSQNEQALVDSFNVKEIPDDNSCLFTAIG